MDGLMNRLSDTAAEDDVPLSKTKRKRVMEEIQSLGEEIVLRATSADTLSSIPCLPENLRVAIREAQRMTRHDEARRRQMQYIGKLMRGIDVEPVRDALSKLKGDSAAETERLHRLEEWRRRMIEDEKAIDEFASLFPSTDIQRLRSLRRAAIRERALDKPPKNFREIFRLLKEIEREIRSDDSGESERDGEGADA
jgi:ribosome-associated protein